MVSGFRVPALFLPGDHTLAHLDQDLVDMATYLGKDASKWSTGDDAVKDGLNPYNYGWPWEVKVKSDGTPDLQKLYGVGRILMSR